MGGVAWAVLDGRLGVVGAVIGAFSEWHFTVTAGGPGEKAETLSTQWIAVTTNLSDRE